MEAAPARIQCPKWGKEWVGEGEQIQFDAKGFPGSGLDMHTASSYLTRFHMAQQCDPSGNGRGEWGGYIKCSQFCKVVSVGALMRYAPGELVFDWGAGCGHALGWLRRVFGVATTGHEFLEELGAKAVQHAGAGAMCSGDGADLSHLPDEYVGHVVSNAAVYHLDPVYQINLVINHLLRILKPGGLALDRLAGH